MRVHRFAPADIFQFRLAQLAVGGLAQVFKFFGLQFAHFARFDIQHQRAIANAANFLDMMADLFEHLAQFAVAALDDDHFVPGIVALADLANLRRRSLHPPGAWLSALDSNARTQSVEVIFARFAADFDEVGLFHACGGAGELVGQVAVVGDQQQAFAQVVEPSNGIKPLAQSS